MYSSEATLSNFAHRRIGKVVNGHLHIIYKEFKSDFDFKNKRRVNSNKVCCFANLKALITGIKFQKTISRERVYGL